jgi:predicted enzyme related to lactoylglutathione lyase
MVEDREGFPPGVPCWVDTSQPDPEAAARFYAGLFGWEFEDRTPVGAPGRYFVARLGGRDVAAIGARVDGQSSSPVWNTYIGVDNADEAAARVVRASGKVLTEPFDVADAGRMGVVADPAGAVFGLWQAYRRKGAQLVNAPGSWNWSNLNTDDLEGSKSFYGEVFGWEFATVGFGGDVTVLCRLPGYGRFLEEFDPDLRERQAKAGVPPSFEDAVGWMVPLASAPAITAITPHWSVSFSVTDADATVKRAAQLQGEVVVPPFDVPPVRLAVLSDLQGAVFTVSKFSMPE